jgi:hypothetical protein
MIEFKQTIFKIEALEKQLLSPIVRKSKKQLNMLLDKTFKEIGRTGVIYNKMDILDSLPYEDTREFIIKNFETNPLTSDVILINYISIEESESVRRSSIWKKNDSGWQIIFHQGTVIK